VNPLVSIICLCYNHAAFVREAVESVLKQSYSPLQIILADDASTDGSVPEIKNLKAEYPQLELLLLPKNVGNCKAFNSAFKLANGKYVVDFATDDVMMPERIQKQVAQFERLDESVGVVFTDAVYIDATGTVFRHHYDYLFSKKLLSTIPQGDVYQDLLQRYFIASPTMLVRKKVLDEINGYDESLTYEDFDFWIRSSRNYKYFFLDEKLTMIRRRHTSLSSGWYVPGDPQLHSTYLVCKKAQQLNRSPEDTLALVKRVRYELRQSVLSENFPEANLFFQLLQELRAPNLLDRFTIQLARLKVPLSSLRKLYHRFRYGDN
jgi:glycosyltransferase involved in cell wall biosynthesis